MHELGEKGEGGRIIVCLKFEMIPTFFQTDLNIVDQNKYRFRDGIPTTGI
jgi:hypothetical protein